MVQRKQSKGPGPGWHKDYKRHSVAARLGWKNRRAGMKPSHTPAELRRIHEERSKRSRVQDERQTAKRLLDPEDPYTDSWVKDPGQMDIRGIDEAGKTPSMNKDELITVLEPRFNKNEHIDEYDRQLKRGDVSNNKVKVIGTKNLSKKAFDELISGFLDDEDWMKGKGGHDTTTPIKDKGFGEFTKKDWEHFRSGAYDLAIKVTDGDRTVYVNPSGYGYARYVYFPPDYKPGDFSKKRKADKKEREPPKPQTYSYGVGSRPIGPGAVPKGHTGIEGGGGKRYNKFGVVQYDRPLTKEEISHFSLTPYMSDKDLNKRADEIIGKMGGYSHKYLDMKPEKANRVIWQFHNNLGGGVAAKDQDKTMEILNDKVRAKIKENQNR